MWERGVWACACGYAGALKELRADVYGLTMRRLRALTPRERAFPKTRALLTDKFTLRNEKGLAIFRWQW